jgi:hypothetical protein
LAIVGSHRFRGTDHQTTSSGQHKEKTLTQQKSERDQAMHDDIMSQIDCYPDDVRMVDLARYFDIRDQTFDLLVRLHDQGLLPADNETVKEIEELIGIARLPLFAQIMEHKKQNPNRIRDHNRCAQIEGNSIVI